MAPHAIGTEHPTVLLDHYLKLLKLPTIKREYKSVAAACAKEGQDAIEFLARLCERECLEREQRAAERRIRATGFPIIKTLDWRRLRRCMHSSGRLQRQWPTATGGQRG